MEANPKWTWAEMIAEFTALGGEAVNIRPGIGARGRGLFAIDPNRDVSIFVPRHLLMDVRDIAHDGSRILVRPDAAVDPRIKAFFERYEEGFSFGAGAAEDCRRTLAAMHELPDAIKGHLRRGAPPGRVRFPEPTAEAVFAQYLKTRRIRFDALSDSAAGDDREVLMPILELVNHAGDRPPFSWSAGARFSGRFPDEILARYNMRDAWDVFVNYGFAASVPVAFSRPLEIRSPSGFHLELRDDLKRFRKIGGITVPEVSVQGQTLVVSHLMLGNRTAPWFSRWVFRQIMHEAQVPNADELFDMIVHLNWSWFLALLELLEEHETLLIVEMRKAVRLQLETIAHCVGSESPTAQLGPIRTPAAPIAPPQQRRGLGAALSREPRLPGRRG